MRTKNSLKNIVVAILSQTVNLVLSFVNRAVFLKTLGLEYLGASGLFGDILSMLSVAELGIGSAIIFAMYKPMAEEDYDRLHSLVDFYRRAYWLIGGLILTLGLGLTPFLELFIKSGYNIDHIQIIYVLVLINSAVSYFFSYKITLLTVAQKNYIEILVRVSILVCQNIIQIICLLTTKNYLLYLLIQICFTIMHNIITSRIATHQFSFLKSKNTIPLDKNEKHALFKNVKALLLHRLGGFFVLGTDSIIISKFISLTANGLYGNYTLIIKSINNFTGLIFTAITSSVGNLCASNSCSKMLDIFNKINFLCFWIAAFCSACLASLMTPFIGLCFGSKNELDISITLIIILNFYLTQMRYPVQVFKNALGLFWQDRWKPLVESIINIIISIILVRFIGLLGVLLGTAISTISVVLWVEPRIVYKYGFKVPVINYFKKYLIYLLLTVVVCYLNYQACNLIKWGGIVGFAVKVVISAILPNALLFVLFHKTILFCYYKTLIIELFNSFILRKK